jgi:hypothetical protein
VIHTYNPSYMGNVDWEDHDPRLIPGVKTHKTLSEKSDYSKKGWKWGLSGRAQQA